LSILILFQSCKATHHDAFHSVLLKAIEKNERVKIVTKDSLVLKYRKVTFEEESFLGVQKVKRTIVKTPIDMENINTIKTENKIMKGILTTTAGVIVGIIVLGLIVGYVYLEFNNYLDEE
jgi:uncharacterized membrane protein